MAIVFRSTSLCPKTAGRPRTETNIVMARTRQTRFRVMAKITPLITYVILRRAIAEKYYTLLLMLQTSALLPNEVVRSRMFREWQGWGSRSSQCRDLLPRYITLILR